MVKQLCRTIEPQRKPVIWVSDKVQDKLDSTAQKMVRGLKFRIFDVEKLYYLRSQNKGTDQLRDNHAADPRICFHI